MNEPVTSIGDYCFRGHLGSGGFAEVKLAFNKQEAKYYACKIVAKSQFCNPRRLQAFESEIYITQQLRHQGLIEIFDLLQDSSFYYVILELCPNGDLFDYIKSQKSLTEPEARLMFKRILGSLEFMHDRGIAHRDIKPENILLDQNHLPKIADFGFSKFFESDALTSTLCGSAYYACPELLSSQSYDAKKADSWACGVLLYVMVTGQLPWIKAQVNEILDQIRNDAFNTPSFLTDKCRDLIRKLMCVDPSSRISVKEALSHPWLADVKLPLILSQPAHAGTLSLAQINTIFGSTYAEPLVGEPVTETAASGRAVVRPLAPSRLGSLCIKTPKHFEASSVDITARRVQRRAIPQSILGKKLR
jgi:serine/threonine protein kinase